MAKGAANLARGIALVGHGVASAAGRLSAGRYSLALSAAAPVQATGHQTLSGAAHLMARGVSQVSGHVSAAGSAALIALHAIASSLATGRAALRGTIPLLARGASEVLSQASVTATAGITARSAARAAGRLNSGAYSLALQGAAGALAGGRAAAQ